MFNNFSISKRLWLSAVLFWSVIFIGAFIGLKGLSEARDDLKLIHEDKMATVNLLTALSLNFEDTRSQVFRAFQHNPINDLHKLHDHPVSDHLNAIEDNQTKNKTLRQLLLDRPVDAQEDSLRDNIIKSLNAWRAPLDYVTSNLREGNYSNEVVHTFLLAAQSEGVEVLNSIKALSDYQTSEANLAADRAASQFDLFLVLYALLILLLVLPASFFIYLSINRVVNGLKQIEGAADLIASGDLSQPILSSGNDEVSRTISKIRLMQYRLSDVVEGVRQSALNIEIGSRYLSDSTEALNDRNLQQSASLEQTSAATEELNGTVEFNAENARQAEESAKKAQQDAHLGGEAVKDVINVMEEITQSSTEISGFVSIINSIAFQTNILALNAAVEAARAGVHGRGFAVVASEVRTLAQRSASAADDIEKIVQNSLEVVNQGSLLVERTGEVMKEIEASNGNLATLISEISHASEEQVIGLSQINLAISQLDESNHQNNELTLQTDKTAEGLLIQSEALIDLVSQFQTN